MLLLNTQRKLSFFWTTSINKMGNKGAGGGVGRSVHDADGQGALSHLELWGFFFFFDV